jgi:hypothetical protein
MLSEIVFGIAPTHYDRFKHDRAFPGVCYISSQVIATFLKRELDGEVRIVYGTFGPNHLFHCWVEFEGVIIDLTQFQFFAYKQRASFYKGLDGKELLAYALKQQESFLIEPHHPTRSLYHALAVMKEEFGHLLLEGMTYHTFLDDVFQSKEYEKAAWAKSLNDESKSFADILEELGLRITRRFFTKWAIVPK